MTISGIEKIGFKGKNADNDIWDENRTGWDDPSNPSVIENIQWFTAIDQGQSTMTETSVDDENGILYTVNLNTVVRREDDMLLAKEHEHQPCIIIVVSADGRTHRMGTTEYPVFPEVERIYNGISVKEMVLKAVYQSETPILS